MDLFVIIGRCEISISFGSFAHIETDLFINGQTPYTILDTYFLSQLGNDVIIAFGYIADVLFL